MALKYDIKILSAVLLVWRCGLLPYMLNCRCKDSLKLGQSQSLSTSTVIISVHMRVWRFKGIDKVGELTLDGYDWL